jgi:hypothetical protein
MQLEFINGLPDRTFNYTLQSIIIACIEGGKYQFVKDVAEMVKEKDSVKNIMHVIKYVKAVPLFSVSFCECSVLNTDYDRTACSVISDDDIDTCTLPINSVPEKPKSIKYGNNEIQMILQTYDYVKIKMIKNLDSYFVSDDKLTHYIQMGRDMAMLFIPQIKNKLKKADNFIYTNINAIVCLNLPLEIDYKFYSDLVKFESLLGTVWFRAELYNYHKYGVETPLTKLFNVNKIITPVIVRAMYKLMLHEIEFYYSITSPRNKKVMLIQSPRNCLEYMEKKSYMFNKYYDGDSIELMTLYGGVKFYDQIKNTELSVNILFNPNIMELIRM